MTVNTTDLEMAIAKLRRFSALLEILGEREPDSDYGTDSLNGLADALGAIIDDFDRLWGARGDAS